MKFTATILAISIATADARRRRLNNAIKGDESDASMSYASVLSLVARDGSK